RQALVPFSLDQARPLTNREVRVRIVRHLLELGSRRLDALELLLQCLEFFLASLDTLLKLLGIALARGRIRDIDQFLGQVKLVGEHFALRRRECGAGNPPGHTERFLVFVLDCVQRPDLHRHRINEEPLVYFIDRLDCEARALRLHGDVAGLAEQDKPLGRVLAILPAGLKELGGQGQAFFRLLLRVIGLVSLANGLLGPVLGSLRRHRQLFDRLGRHNWLALWRGWGRRRRRLLLRHWLRLSRRRWWLGLFLRLLRGRRRFLSRLFDGFLFLRRRYGSFPPRRFRDHFFFGQDAVNRPRPHTAYEKDAHGLAADSCPKPRRCCRPGPRTLWVHAAPLRERRAVGQFAELGRLFLPGPRTRTAHGHFRFRSDRLS